MVTWVPTDAKTQGFLHVVGKLHLDEKAFKSKNKKGHRDRYLLNDTDIGGQVSDSKSSRRYWGDLGSREMAIRCAILSTFLHV